MKSLTRFIAVTLFALALALPSLAQNPKNKTFVSADSSFTVTLPGTPEKKDQTVGKTDAGLGFVQNVYTLTDEEDKLDFGIVEAVYTEKYPKTSDEMTIAFNRKSSAVVIGAIPVSVPGADSATGEVIDVAGQRALYIVAVKGDETLQLVVATVSPDDSQIDEITTVYKSLTFNTKTQN